MHVHPVQFINQHSWWLSPPRPTSSRSISSWPRADPPRRSPRCQRGASRVPGVPRRRQENVGITREIGEFAIVTGNLFKTVGKVKILTIKHI